MSFFPVAVVNGTFCFFSTFFAVSFLTTGTSAGFCSTVTSGAFFFCFLAFFGAAAGSSFGISTLG
jgi:hypothetical protein